MHPEPIDVGDAGILDPGVVHAAFPRQVGFEHDAASIDADGDAVFDDDFGEADAGHVAGGDHSRQEVQATVGRVPG